MYRGPLSDGSGNPLLACDNGLEDLTFGIGGNGGSPNTLYFATGLNGETYGLVGAIGPLSGIAEGGAVANTSGGTLEVSHGTLKANQAVGTVLGAGVASANTDGPTLVLGHCVFIGNQALDRAMAQGRLV